MGGGKKYKIISEIERKPNCQRRKLQLEFINQKLHKPFWTIFVQRVRFGFYFNFTMFLSFLLLYLRNYILWFTLTVCCSVTFSLYAFLKYFTSVCKSFFLHVFSCCFLSLFSRHWLELTAHNFLFVSSFQRWIFLFLLEFFSSVSFEILVFWWPVNVGLTFCLAPYEQTFQVFCRNNFGFLCFRNLW